MFRKTRLPIIWRLAPVSLVQYLVQAGFLIESSQHWSGCFPSHRALGRHWGWEKAVTNGRTQLAQSLLSSLLLDQWVPPPVLRSQGGRSQALDWVTAVSLCPVMTLERFIRHCFGGRLLSWSPWFHFPSGFYPCRSSWLFPENFKAASLLSWVGVTSLGYVTSPKGKQQSAEDTVGYQERSLLSLDT